MAIAEVPDRTESLFPEDGKPASTGDSPLKFLLYTNINNLRHFGSLDAVVSRDCFQTTIYDESFGSLISSSLILTPRRLSQGVLEEFGQAVNPVVLEFDLQESKQLSGFLIGPDYSCVPLSGGVPLERDDLLLVLPGYIPMSVVGRVVFRSRSEMADFRALRFKGIEFDEAKYAVEPGLFAGDFHPRVDRIREMSDSVNQQVDENTRKVVWQRDRERGSLLAASGGLVLSHNGSVVVNFDMAILQLVARLRNEGEYAYEQECIELGPSLNQKLKSMDLFFDADLCCLPRDPTPFPHWDDCLKRLQAGDVVPPNPDPRDAVLTENLCDRIAYECLLEGLRDEKAERFRPVEFLNSFLEKFGEIVPQRLPESRLGEFDALRRRYQEGIALVNRVVNQYQKASEVLKTWQGRFYSLKSFMTFATAYSPDSFGDLENRLGKYVLTPFERRLVWSMFGMLNGVGPLGESLKQRRDLLIVTELIMQSPGGGAGLSNFTDELKRSLNGLMSGGGPSGSPETFQVTLWSKLGLTLAFKVADVAEPIRIAILKILTSGDPIEKWKEAILNTVSVPEKYFCYMTELDGGVVVERGVKGLRFRHKRPALVTNNKVWDNWDLFVAEFLEKRDVFAGQTKEQLDMWKKMLRGDPVEPKELLGPRRRTGVRRRGTRKG